MDDSSDEVERVPAKKKKKPKGFDGEVSDNNIEQQLGMMPFKSIYGTSIVHPDDRRHSVQHIPVPTFTSERTLETIPRADGGAETHVEVTCTLAEIARATNLRVDDAAFALSECGLLMRRIAKTAGGENEADEQTPVAEDDTIVVTRTLVEQVARERKVKIMYLDLSCVIP